MSLYNHREEQYEYTYLGKHRSLPNVRLQHWEKHLSSLLEKVCDWGVIRSLAGVPLERLSTTEFLNFALLDSSNSDPPDPS